jgi:hypothetical protein
MHPLLPETVSEQTNQQRPTCAELMTMAQRELTAFIGAVTELFGSDEAMLAAIDWLNELMSMDSLPGSKRRDLRCVTVSAAARLAKRMAVESREAF